MYTSSCICIRPFFRPLQAFSIQNFNFFLTVTLTAVQPTCHVNPLSPQYGKPRISYVCVNAISMPGYLFTYLACNGCVSVSSEQQTEGGGGRVVWSVCGLREGDRGFSLCNLTGAVAVNSGRIPLAASPRCDTHTLTQQIGTCVILLEFVCLVGNKRACLWACFSFTTRYLTPSPPQTRV